MSFDPVPPASPPPGSAAPDGEAGGEDVLLRALLPEHALRVVVAVTTGLAREASRRHGAVGGPAAAIGRAATAGALLATLTKSRERVTAEFSGGGPLGPLIVDANADGHVRVYIKNPGVPVPVIPGARVSLGQAVGVKGVVRVARDLGLREIVTGQTGLVDGEIDTDLEHYLMASEQLPSVLAAETLLSPELEITIAAGVLVQTLPGSDAVPLLDKLRTQVRSGALARALAALPAGPPDPAALAETLLELPAGHLLVLDTRPLRFVCPCSKQRALNTLAVLSQDDLSEMVAENRGAEVICEFCRAKHSISQSELEQAAAAAARPHPPTAPS